jgi:hypothetical protein
MVVVDTAYVVDPAMDDSWLDVNSVTDGTMVTVLASAGERLSNSWTAGSAPSV